MSQTIQGKRGKLVEFTTLALLIALIVLLGLTPLGLIPLGFINVTILCVPVVIGTLYMDWKKGLALGLSFGAVSFYSALVKPSALVSTLMAASPVLTAVMTFVPRLCVPLVAWWVYRRMSRKTEEKAKRSASMFFGSLVAALLAIVMVLVLYFSGAVRFPAAGSVRINTYELTRIIPEKAVNGEGVAYADRSETDKGPWELDGITYDDTVLTVVAGASDSRDSDRAFAYDPEEQVLTPGAGTEEAEAGFTRQEAGSFTWSRNQMLLMMGVFVFFIMTCGALIALFLSGKGFQEYIVRNAPASVAAVCGSLTNTVLYLGMMLLFYVMCGIDTSGVLALIGGTALIAGLSEAAVAAVLVPPILSAVKKIRRS